MDDDGVKTENGTTDIAFVHHKVASINSQYAARFQEGHIDIQKVAASHQTIQIPRSYGLRQSTKPVFELSTSRPNLLAISGGAQAQIFDVSIQALTCTISGIGRTITAIAWSDLNDYVLATGSIDGSICIWDLRAPERPIRRLRAPRGSCKAISFSTADKNSVACIQEQEISIWDLRRPSLHPTSTIRAEGTKFCSDAWQPAAPGRLVVASDDSLLKLYDVSNSVNDGGDVSSSSSGSSEPGAAAAFMQTTHGGDLTPLWTARVESSLTHVHFLNDYVLYALAWHGRRAFVYELKQSGNGILDLYSHDFESQVHAIHIRVQSGTGVISAIGEDGVTALDLPVSVLDKIRRHTSNLPADRSKLVTGDRTASPVVSADADNRTLSTATMKPTSILSQRPAATGFFKTSDQLQLQRRSRDQNRLSKRGRAKSSLTSDSKDLSTPVNRSVRSSLGLPERNDENGSTSMPFLSPSIPSQHSPSYIPSLEDSTLALPPLAMPSFDSSLPSTSAPTIEERDSDDSDDDTFVEALEGSAAFLPGGINVPLPKACGALFAPNGQLLTFFPPKVRPSSVHAANELQQDDSNGRQGKARKVSRLFPSFGKFGTVGQSLESEDSDSSISDTSDSFAQDFGRWRQVTFPHSSFPSHQSWPSKVSPIKTSYTTQSSQSKIVINVYEIDGISILCTSQRALAENYRILRNGSESGADICDHNSGAAKAAGLQDVAYIWSLLSILLCNKVPLELLSGELADTDVLVVARQAKTLARSDSGVDLAKNASELHSYVQLRWGYNPFGAPWLIRRILAWAEQRADTQLLACVCAVLTDAENNVGTQNDASLDSFSKDLSNSASDYLLTSSARRRSSGNRSQPIPVLRTNSIANSSSVYESPVKVHRHSNTSSMNASQPTTPHIDSTSSTPPFPLSLSRQATHLSTSGSASPEYQRGSFSAAAKYYALSITDKFASYGTSPPTKKLGASPSVNELSTSMPSGSWGKSVSFAMSSTTTDTTRGSLLSRSYDEPANDNGYDSDRTVDDGSSVHQTKESSGAIRVTDINQSLFSDEISGAAITSLIPEDLVTKSYAWCGYYAEQLRSWDLQVQAAELEKIIGISDPTETPGLGVFDAKVDAPGANFRDRSVDRTCAICFTVVRLMELVCPSCCHVSHLSCLEDYIAAPDVDFECPTSCGCQCSEIVYTVQAVQHSSPQTRPGNKKRLLSYTDPRNWRARIEEDNSW